MPVDVLDLGAVVKSGQVTVTPEEHPDDRAARLRREERASIIEEYKGIVVFAVILCGIMSIAALSAYKGLLDPTASPETQRWGQGILTVVMSSAISFFIGRKVGK
jgi:hypothetical protein